MRKKLVRLATTVVWTVIVVTLVIGAIEWGLAAAGRAEPELVWFWDASVLSPQPIFVKDPDGGPDARTTDLWLTHVDNMPQRFRAKKDAGTFRVFCVGASTTAGWPFHRRGSYPRWLGAFLNDLEPDRRVEVINAGIHGFDTERVLAAVEEILAYQPDMVILQTGYNDYGSWRLRHSGWRPRFHAWMVMHSRIYNGLLPRLTKPPETAASRSGTLLSGQEETALLDSYRRQLERFARLLEGHGVKPVIVNLSYTDRYLGDHPMARTIWPAMNKIIKDVSLDEHTGFVDISDESKQPELMIDSMHSTTEGYRLIAHHVADALCEQKLLPAPCQPAKLHSDDEYAKALEVNDPEASTRSNLSLAKFYLDKNDEQRADKALADAERTAPAPNFVYQTVLSWKDPRLCAHLEQVDRQLGFDDRADRFAKLRGP